MNYQENLQHTENQCNYKDECGQNPKVNHNEQEVDEGVENLKRLSILAFVLLIIGEVATPVFGCLLTDFEGAFYLWGAYNITLAPLLLICFFAFANAYGEALKKQEKDVPISDAEYGFDFETRTFYKRMKDGTREYINGNKNNC